MFKPTKVADIELDAPLEDITGLHGYEFLQALIRLHGAPIGFVRLRLSDGGCRASALRQEIFRRHGERIIQRRMMDALAAPAGTGKLSPAGITEARPVEYHGSLPSLTVAVCTRDRAADLALCLESLAALDYPALDRLVIDNAPSSDATERLVRERHPNVRYVREPRPGLDWARNRAVIEARGEIVAYTDDDVLVDRHWAKAFGRLFAEHPEVMAATGLVIPHELETEAQWLFEHYGGFGRGFTRKWFSGAAPGAQVSSLYGGAGKFGTGANMAFRRDLLLRLGGFDPALDVGTVTNGGGDLEMYFRVLKEGHALVYEPNALVRHRHRRDYARLRAQIANNGIGFYSHLVRCMRAYPEERLGFLRLGLWWFYEWNLSRLIHSYIQPGALPRDLIVAELKGTLSGLGRYRQARRNADGIAASFKDLPVLSVNGRTAGRSESLLCGGTAVRMLELSQPVQALTDVTAYSKVRLFVAWQGQPLGRLDIGNNGHLLSASRLREAVVRELGRKILEHANDKKFDVAHAELMTAMAGRYARSIGTQVPHALADHISVSIVVATRDRPDDLRACLRSLVAQATRRRVEIVVVDNNPSSGASAAVVAEFAQFPHVLLVPETRKGLSYARNAGIAASSGDIVVMTDDDVTAPRDWLEKLVAPFAEADVWAVTGNVLPLELDTPTQGLFESYGGLGRGFNAADHTWEAYAGRRRAIPTWKFGATANAAFRAAAFCHPDIGLLDEALGAGMPTGCSEDTYLFYKLLKAGFTLRYQPAAFVWHKHRREHEALRRQIYSYSKGHVAYHLTTWLRDRDIRGLTRIMIELPHAYLWRIKERLRGRSNYPLSLVLLEIVGNLAGPWALLQARRRVRREGRSQAYVARPDRAAQAA